MIQSLNKAFILICFCVSMIFSPTKAQQLQNEGNIVSTEMVKYWFKTIHSLEYSLLASHFIL